MEYRLLKKYPGLPIDWEEGMLVGIGDEDRNNYYPCHGKYSSFSGVRPHNVEKYPEYWELVKDCLLVTEDGLEVFDANQILYGTLIKGIWQTNQMPCRNWLNHSDSWKVFYSEGARDQYRRDNIPQFSLEELYHCANYWGMTEVNTDDIVTAVLNFRSKND